MLLKWLHGILGMVFEGIEKTLLPAALGNKATASLLPAKFGRPLVAGIVSLALLATLLLQGREDTDGIVLQDPGAPSRGITKHASWVEVLAFSPDGTLLASGWGKPGSAGVCQLWDVAGRQVRAVLQTASAVYTAAFAPDSRTLALGSWDGTVQLWEVATQRRLHLLQLPVDWARALAFTPDGNCLVAGTGHAVVFWDVLTGRERVSLAASDPLAFSPNGRILATGKDDAAGARLWDWQTGEARGDIQVASGPNLPVRSLALAFAPDGKTLISADSDTFIRLWDVERQQLRTRLFRYADRIVTLAFSPDKHLLATGGIDRTIRLWDVQTRQLVATLQGHTGAIHCLAFAPDGRKLASGSFDETVRLWRVADARAGAQP